MKKQKTKILSTIILIFALHIAAFTQNENDEMYNRSFGLDASFINNFLPLDNRIGFVDEHLFHFFKHKENNKFSRHGLDLRVSANFEDDDSNFTRNNLFISPEYKFTRGKKKNVFKRGYIYYGAEVLLGYTFNQNKAFTDQNSSPESTISDQRINAGIGPMIGFEYKFSKRFSIYTEGGAYLNFRYDISKFDETASNNRDFKNTNFTISNSYNFPSSIILVFYY